MSLPNKSDCGHFWSLNPESKADLTTSLLMASFALVGAASKVGGVVGGVAGGAVGGVAGLATNDREFGKQVLIEINSSRHVV